MSTLDRRPAPQWQSRQQLPTGQTTSWSRHRLRRLLGRVHGTGQRRPGRRGERSRHATPPQSSGHDRAI